MIALKRFATTGKLRHLLVIVFIGFTIAAPTDALAQSAPAQFAISVLSSPSYAVTGGDALVQVSVPASTPLADVIVRLNGQDVTAAF